MGSCLQRDFDFNLRMLIRVMLLAAAICAFGSHPVLAQEPSFIVGDFNGDGKSDMLRWRAVDRTWVVNLSTGSDFREVIWPGAPESGGETFVGDLNGDGKTDIFFWRDSEKDWVVNLSTGSGWKPQSWKGAWGSDGGGQIFVGDLNGDGKTDVFMWRNSDKDWTVNLSTGSGWKQQSWKGAWGSDGQPYVGDLNGDGKTDVFMWRDSDKTWSVNLSTGSGWKSQTWHGAWGSDGPIFVGDLNGDGKTDVFMWRDSDKYWAVNISDGKDWIRQAWHGAWGSDGQPYVCDLNGDGKTDLFMWRDSDKSWVVNISDGKDWKGQSWHGAPPSRSLMTFNGDVNNDHRTDLIVLNEEDNAWHINISTGSDFIPDVWCSGRPCGTDGTPISVARNPRGRIIGMYGTSHDGIKRSIGFSAHMYEMPGRPGTTITSLSECVNECPPGQVNRLERCESANKPTIGLGTPTMALCQSGEINVVGSSSLEYFDSSGKRLTETLRHIKGSGTATYEIENNNASASMLVSANHQAVLRLNNQGAVSIQMFSYPPDQNALRRQQGLAQAFPEINDAEYFGKALPLIFAEVGVNLPPPPTSPDWFRYWGDAMIFMGFAAFGPAAVEVYGAKAAYVVGAAGAMGSDMWHKEQLSRDRVWELLVNPLCAEARALDELESMFVQKGIPQSMTFFHGLGCDK